MARQLFSEIISLMPFELGSDLADHVIQGPLAEGVLNLDLHRSDRIYRRVLAHAARCRGGEDHAYLWMQFGRDQGLPGHICKLIRQTVAHLGFCRQTRKAGLS